MTSAAQLSASICSDLWVSHQESGDLDDLEYIIQEAISTISPDDSPSLRAALYLHIASAVSLLIAEGRIPNQLAHSSEVLQVAADDGDAQHYLGSQRPVLLNALCASLLVLFEQTGNTDSLARAIDIAEEALRSNPSIDLTAGLLSNLAILRLAQYRVSGNGTELRLAVESVNRAVEELQDDDSSSSFAHIPVVRRKVLNEFASYQHERTAAPGTDVRRSRAIGQRSLTQAGTDLQFSDRASSSRSQRTRRSTGPQSRPSRTKPDRRGQYVVIDIDGESTLVGVNDLIHDEPVISLTELRQRHHVQNRVLKSFLLILLEAIALGLLSITGVALQWFTMQSALLVIVLVLVPSYTTWLIFLRARLRK